MYANDLKKGMRVRMRSGWYGTIVDNAKGNRRMVDVEGFREIGSVYTHDILAVLSMAGDVPHWEPVQLTPAQTAKAKRIIAAGF